MSRISPFFSIEQERKNYMFANKPVLLRRDEDYVQFPCVGLYQKAGMIPVEYPGFERWYLNLNKAEAMAATTMRKRASAVCAFLNYALSSTAVEYLHQLTLNDIRTFLVSYKQKENGEARSTQGWYEGVGFVYEFLGNYYIHNQNYLPFAYRYDDLITLQAVSRPTSRRKLVVKEMNHLSVRAPRQLKRKNRQLLYGYMELFLQVCEMYDPDITVGPAAQGFAGVREGGVVNLTFERIKFVDGGFGTIGKIELDLTTPAPFATAPRKTEFGNIKVPRIQAVFPDFHDRFKIIYDNHVARMESRGFAVTGDAPLLVNRWGKPMSVDTYKQRVKAVFYNHFLPALKRISEAEGRWAIDAPFIEAYEDEYPGAHAFRHWFSMYLFERTYLKPDEISQWRGDKNRDSVLTYLHVNTDMLKAYRTHATSFQRSLLQEVLL